MQLSVSNIAAKIADLKPDTRLAAPNASISFLLTDSRSLESPSSTIFFAIPTKGNDGHRFVEELYARGVRSFVVDHIPGSLREKADVNLLVVGDTVRALQQIGCRTDFGGEMVAITGSRGKTTLKEWIFQLLEPLRSISRSPRSYNSRIGVPLSVWSIDPQASLALIEAGVSRRGEMEVLAQCIRPDTVIITNIGDAHSDGFDSDREKAEEKALLASLPETKTVIYCAESQLIADAVGKSAPNARHFTWSLSPEVKADITASASVLDNSVRIDYDYGGSSYSFSAPVTSSADIENVMNALAFMLHEGIDSEVISQRFGVLHPIGTRLNVSEGVNGCSVILDSYTSDFSSLRPALDFLRRRKTPGQTATLILSDIHHESGHTETLYRAVAELLTTTGIDRLIGVGKAISAHASLFQMPSTFFPDTESLLLALSTSDFADEAILLKGSPEYDFASIAEMLETRKHETVLEVNLDSIVANFNYFRRHLPAGTGLVCMVKASGYGAGSYEIAKTLQDCGAAYLAVAVLDEGIELRQRGITMPIMVMNPKVVNYRSMFANRLEPEIYSFQMLADVIREAEKNDIRNYPIHIKLDTGMHRMGFVGDELPELMRILARSPQVKLTSAFSHLATADCLDMDDYTELQLTRFRQYTDYMQSQCPYRFMRHILNSAGILRYGRTEHYDMARLGIGLYGANTLPPEIERPLAVVSTLRTVIIAIREWQPGETVGYGRHGRIDRPSRIATIPIGYADGMNRRFGRGVISVKVGPHWAPTVGNICMDACMIDVTDIDCKVGDSVEIFGPNAPLQRLADALGTIPYEVLTSVSPRVKRIYYRE